jgi:hypothetical protein
MLPAVGVDFMKAGGNERGLTSGGVERKIRCRQLFVHWLGLIQKVQRRSGVLESVVVGAVVVLARRTFSCDLNTFTQGGASVGRFGLQGSDKPRNARLLTRLSCPRTISSRYL